MGLGLRLVGLGFKILRVGFPVPGDAATEDYESSFCREIAPRVVAFGSQVRFVWNGILGLKAHFEVLAMGLWHVHFAKDAKSQNAAWKRQVSQTAGVLAPCLGPFTVNRLNKYVQNSDAATKIA